MFNRMAAIYFCLCGHVFFTNGVSQPLIYTGSVKQSSIIQNDSTPISKTIAKQDSLAEPKGLLNSADKDPIRFDLGITYNIFTQKGIFGDIIYNNTYAIQVQYLSYHEFQGIFPSILDLPYEEYGFTGSNFGAYIKQGHSKLGAFAGLGFLNGIARSDFLRTEGPECGMICWDNSTTNYYKEIQLDGMALSLKVEYGIFVKHFGISLSEQIFFIDDLVLLHTSLNFAFGNM